MRFQRLYPACQLKKIAIFAGARVPGLSLQRVRTIQARMHHVNAQFYEYFDFHEAA
jgi:hypothetical protein